MLSFYNQFADQSMDVLNPPQQPTHVMDRWLLSRVHTLVEATTQHMDNYDVVRASKGLIDFIDELSTWYLRLSRDRFRGADNQEASQVFGFALYTLAQLYAPLTPFFPELVHHTLVDEQTSIHHTDWPTTQAMYQDKKLETAMEAVQAVVEMAHAQRAEVGINLRKPLATLTVTSPAAQLESSLLEVLAIETNVKQVIWEKGESLQAVFDTTITPELQAEGDARELIRQIQTLRRKEGLERDMTVSVTVTSIPAGWQEEIETKTNTTLVIGDAFGLH
jgi:isoleucyl-tRNA synthetase